MVHIERFILPYPNWNVPRRGMRGHSVFDGSLFIAVPCLPHVRLGLMMIVTLTHHSSITVISLQLYASCYVEVELCFRFQILSGVFCHSGLYPAVWPFGRCWG